MLIYWYYKNSRVSWARLTSSVGRTLRTPALEPSTPSSPRLLCKRFTQDVFLSMSVCLCISVRALGLCWCVAMLFHIPFRPSTSSIPWRKGTPRDASAVSFFVCLCVYIFNFNFNLSLYFNLASIWKIDDLAITFYITSPTVSTSKNNTKLTLFPDAQSIRWK